DLSYNNFGSESSCPQGNINLFGSASMGNVSGSTVPCFKKPSLSRKVSKWYSYCTFMTYNVMLCRSVINSLLPADFKPPSENSSSTSAGTVVGIVAAAVVFVFLILGILWWKGCFGQKISSRHGIF
ncbi:hypothetical protein OIU85_002392, partial [Salix viminalis]